MRWLNLYLTSLRTRVSQALFPWLVAKSESPAERKARLEREFIEWQKWAMSYAMAQPEPAAFVITIPLENNPNYVRSNLANWNYADTSKLM